ncbi:MAG: hypothetical protein HC818_08005, partial [Synechococcaceae cyanobacterium RM1_1_27]|nr:hypothetical protein [Synechococcaceae cyanobacterium RM1_1_27]
MTLSNTYNLINNFGWSSIQIEANPRSYQALADRYKNKQGEVECINKIVAFEGEDSLDKILATTKLPIDFDLISIDVDGTEVVGAEIVDRVHLAEIDFLVAHALTRGPCPVDGLHEVLRLVLVAGETRLRDV